MGIDPLDLILRVESSFGVRIDFEDLSSIWHRKGMTAPLDNSMTLSARSVWSVA